MLIIRRSHISGRLATRRRRYLAAEVSRIVYIGVAVLDLTPWVILLLLQLGLCWLQLLLLLQLIAPYILWLVWLLLISVDPASCDITTATAVVIIAAMLISMRGLRIHSVASSNSVLIDDFLLWWGRVCLDACCCLCFGRNCLLDLQ